MCVSDVQATTAPLIQLNSWAELPAFIRKVTSELKTNEGRKKWKLHQGSLDEWSRSYSRFIVRSFESHLLTAYMASNDLLPSLQVL